MLTKIAHFLTRFCRLATVTLDVMLFMIGAVLEFAAVC